MSCELVKAPIIGLAIDCEDTNPGPVLIVVVIVLVFVVVVVVPFVPEAEVAEVTSKKRLLFVAIEPARGVVVRLLLLLL